MTEVENERPETRFNPSLSNYSRPVTVVHDEAYPGVSVINTHRLDTVTQK
jgi:hypothetical protein